MTRIETDIPGVCIIEPQVFEDERGFFCETYHARKFAEMGITDTFVQDNHSRSVGGTVRGLHYQIGQAQAKLCRVIVGEVLDVAVDLRRGSPTFGKWVSVLLSAQNRRQIYIPEGFAHGFAVMSDVAEFLYKCSDFYCHPAERGVAWNDPKIGVEWPLRDEPILSAKDQRNPFLADVSPEDLPVYVARTATG